MKENLNFCFNINGEILGAIILVFLYLFYIRYNRRLNDYILRNADNFIILTILLFIYIYYFNLIDGLQANEYYVFIFGLSAFFITFIQFRKNKEYEIIQEYFKNKEQVTSLENLIHNFKLLLPIIKFTNNLTTLIKGQIRESINVKTVEFLKGNIKDELLKINSSLGNVNTFISILEDIKNDNLKLIKTLLRNEDIQKIQAENYRIDYITNLMKTAESAIFKKTSFIDKIIIFIQK